MWTYLFATGCVWVVALVAWALGVEGQVFWTLVGGLAGGGLVGSIQIAASLAGLL